MLQYIKNVLRMFYISSHSLQVDIGNLYSASFRQCWRFSKEWRFQEKFRHAIVRKLKSNRKRNRSARRIASGGLISSQDASKARYKLRYTLIEQYRG